MNAIVPPRSERIRAYLDDSLDEAELERFELELFHNPDLVDAVEAERLLRLGMRSLDSLPQAEPEPEPIPMPAAASAPARRIWPIAAAVLAGAAVPGLMLLQREAPGEAEANVAVLRLDAPRSGSADALLLAPADAPRLVLQIPLLAQAGVDAYELDLDGAGRTLTIPALHPRSDGMVAVAIRSERLPPGSYTARIYARRGDGSRSEVLSRSFTLAR